MAIDDRDYLHEDRKAKIRRGQMADIYYNPKEFRGDRGHVHGSVTMPPAQGTAPTPRGVGRPIIASTIHHAPPVGIPRGCCGSRWESCPGSSPPWRYWSWSATC